MSHNSLLQPIIDNEKVEMELSIVIPCLNEEHTLVSCITKAQHFLHANNIIGEIVVADNNSTDRSREIAKELGSKVIIEQTKGYGSALKAGIRNASGKYVIMGDADNSYDFENLEAFIEKLRLGYDLVMGNRFTDKMEKGAMPFINRFLGNPVLTKIGQILFTNQISDFHCGLRGFSRYSINKLTLQSKGMEFATEVVAKAAVHNFNITEVPIIYYKDGRNGPSKLNPFTDGVRHLIFMFSFFLKSLPLRFKKAT